MASGADRVLDGAELYDTLEAAIADCTFVLATTARAHDQAKPVVGAARGGAALRAADRGRRDRRASCSGASASGLKTRRSALADRIVTLPVNPAFASLNLAQAVLHRRLRVVQAACGGALPFAHAAEIAAGDQAAACSRSSKRWSASSKRSSSSARPTSATPCRSICATSSRACSRPSRTSARCTASSRRSRKAARGRREAACSNGDEAALLRTLLAEHGQERAPSERGAGARAGAAAAPQSDRSRADVLGCASATTGASSAWASSGRCRSARTSPTSCRFRCGW